MPSLSSTYLLPAIFLNPAFILHLINTFASHNSPPSPRIPSVSPHPIFESLGPLPGSTWYMDMHGDDQLCWRYTAIMVVVQLLAFGRIADNRVQIKAKRAAKRAAMKEKIDEMLEEKKCKEKVAALEEERRAQIKIGGAEGGCVWTEVEKEPCVSPCMHGRAANGSVKPTKLNGGLDGAMESETSEDLTETSEEELFI